MFGRIQRSLFLSVAVAATVLVAPRVASAHCDTVDGPVVAAGKKALDSGNLSHALVWIQSENADELRGVFARVIEVRANEGTARELADRYFLETLVRLHRAGEGEPFTGLKPAGEGHTRAIRSADAAVARGSVAGTRKLLTAAMKKGLKKKFAAVQHHRRYDVDDVAAGREYVEAYVSFVHYVEGLHGAISGGGAHAGH